MREIHPDYQAMTTLEELAQAIAGNCNAQYRLGNEYEAFMQDLMDCLVRAQQIATTTNN